MSNSIIKIIQPQEGYQMKALACQADILISGGCAGPGKTFALLLESCRNIDNKKYGGVIFRRTSVQIRSEGGLWDTSQEIYRGAGGVPRESSLEWDFRSGAKMKFSHLEYEKNVYDWQGAQICFLGFDEICHFSELMFFYLLSRNRSTCGVKPYARATCNPEPGSWVYKLISWWIDPDSGLPIKERDGVVRFFIKYGNDYIWGDTYDDVKEKAQHILQPLIEKSGLQPEDFIKSISYINGDIYDNKILLATNPEYLGNLLSQDEQTRRQLLEGNWKESVSDNDIYQYDAFIGMFNNVMELNNKGKYITADIAMKGSDKFIVIYWEGHEIKNISIMEKSDGKEVVSMISSVATHYGVQNHNICFDADGVGSFIDGFIPGAIGFNNGGSVIEILDPVSKKTIKENYQNLKTQCYYRSGERLSKGEYKVDPKVASMMYDRNMTIQQRFMFERKAIKRDKADFDGKLRILPKDQMKIKLNGESPDLMDAFMMREIFDLKRSYVFVS